MKIRICFLLLFILPIVSSAHVSDRKVIMAVSDSLKNISVRIDSFCAHWHICLHDSIPLESATLIDDPTGDIYGKTPKVFKNVVFDSKSDSNGTGLIIFSGIDTFACFDVLVSNPFDTAYAPLYFVDKKGFHVIIELHYKPGTMLSLLPSIPPNIDSVTFSQTAVGQKTCSTFVYFSLGGSIHIDRIDLQNLSSFLITDITPTLPITLKVGDTLKVEVCFNPQDTFIYKDSIITRTDCFSGALPISGQGATALIYATDIDFGNVSTGDTVCKSLTIYNKGLLPFILTRRWLLKDISDFYIDSVSASKLPDTLLPGGNISLTFCYHPTFSDKLDSTIIEWSTTIDPAYANQIKSWSYLKGNSMENDVKYEKTKKTISIHPNPVTGNSINISFPNAVGGSSTLAIYDILGREVYTQNIQTTGDLDVPIGQLQPGSYLARIVSGSWHAEKKFEILR